jgi:hypothetical protein
MPVKPITRDDPARFLAAKLTGQRWQEVLLERWRAGERLEARADDYGIMPGEAAGLALAWQLGYEDGREEA